MPNPLEIDLIPWDHTSEAHVTRMTAQREACGWAASEVVPSWVPRAEKGLKIMFWVALADSFPDREEFLQAHKDRFPDETNPLKDTAQSLNLVPREPSGADFVPVGHVALNKGPTPDLEGHVDGLLPEEGVYWITSLFISPSIQRRGLGRNVMSHVESLVATPNKDTQEAALSGTTIALDTPPKEWQVSNWAKENWWDPLNLPMPKVSLFFLSRDISYLPLSVQSQELNDRVEPQISNLEWYQQQGYSVFAELPDHRPAPMPNGSMVNVPLCLLKKIVR
ncbi:hypothetical protein E0Z10_g9275 [Xylaria hypoxylon]|uniref:N-acetyltransferase domain-containing protein n=1 Tax=Xylaria hypoxylon TaxID=37992 RepID=A0A4Z0YJT4_9PEZI|nr:hypothetical protein E0Z10_g9275 [Xylaria hypoxylon]